MLHNTASTWRPPTLLHVMPQHAILSGCQASRHCKKSKPCATRNLLKTKRERKISCGDDPVNPANPANSAIPMTLAGIPSAEFELAFIDFQGLDAGLKSGWWNSKLNCRSRRTGNPSSCFGQHCLDNLSLAARLNLNLEGSRFCSARCGRKSTFGKPAFIHRKILGFAHDDGSLDDVL